ncbi:hypothetical protein IJF93_00550 [Candidatus Saccharibacteria bacterium]|nr:hypothetical protein [Candidatus Saccharibacteria bacterium]
MQNETIRKSGHKKSWEISIGIFLLLFAVILFLIFLLHGQTITSVEKMEDISSDSVTCIAEDSLYPFFEYDNSDYKITKIDIIFNGDGIGSIGLVQQMTYPDNHLAQISATINHGDMNKAFGLELGPDAFRAHYTAIDGEMKMSLYATSGELNKSAYKFFLIKSDIDNKDEYIENYINQGFVCSEKNNN